MQKNEKFPRFGQSITEHFRFVIFFFFGHRQDMPSKLRPQQMKTGVCHAHGGNSNTDKPLKVARFVTVNGREMV